MSDEDEHQLVDNPQRTWLTTAKSVVDPAAESLKTCLDEADSALTGGAWTGTEGDAWGRDLAERRRQLRSTAQRVQDDLDDEIASKPLRVCRCQITSALPAPFSFGSYGTGTGAGYPSVSPSCSE